MYLNSMNNTCMRAQAEIGDIWKNQRKLHVYIWPSESMLKSQLMNSGVNLESTSLRDSLIISLDGTRIPLEGALYESRRTLSVRCEMRCDLPKCKTGSIWFQSNSISVTM